MDDLKLGKMKYVLLFNIKVFVYLLLMLYLCEINKTKPYARRLVFCSRSPHSLDVLFLSLSRSLGLLSLHHSRSPSSLALHSLTLLHLTFQ